MCRAGSGRYEKSKQRWASYRYWIPGQIHRELESGNQVTGFVPEEEWLEKQVEVFTKGTTKVETVVKRAKYSPSREQAESQPGGLEESHADDLKLVKAAYQVLHPDKPTDDILEVLSTMQREEKISRQMTCGVLQFAIEDRVRLTMIERARLPHEDDDKVQVTAEVLQKVAFEVNKS